MNAALAAGNAYAPPPLGPTRRSSPRKSRDFADLEAGEAGVLAAAPTPAAARRARPLRRLTLALVVMGLVSLGTNIWWLPNASPPPHGLLRGTAVAP